PASSTPDYNPNLRPGRVSRFGDPAPAPHTPAATTASATPASAKQEATAPITPKPNPAKSTKKRKGMNVGDLDSDKGIKTLTDFLRVRRCRLTPEQFQT